MEHVHQALDHLEALHRAATPEPWFLVWAEPNEPDVDPPDAVGIYEHGAFSPLLVIDEDHVGDDEAANDLRVVEAARNALPLLLRAARAAANVRAPAANLNAAVVELDTALSALTLLLPADGSASAPPPPLARVVRDEHGERVLLGGRPLTAEELAAALNERRVIIVIGPAELHAAAAQALRMLRMLNHDEES